MNILWALLAAWLGSCWTMFIFLMGAASVNKANEINALVERMNMQYPPKEMPVQPWPDRENT